MVSDQKSFISTLVLSVIVLFACQKLFVPERVVAPVNSQSQASVTEVKNESGNFEKQVIEKTAILDNENFLLCIYH